MSTQNPQAPRHPVVVAPQVRGSQSLSVGWSLLAIVASLAAHLLLIVLMMSLDYGAAAAAPGGEVRADNVLESESPDRDPPFDEVVGLDPTSEPGNDADRIEEVIVPGLVNPVEPIGIVEAPENLARNLSAPPGSGQGSGKAPLGPAPGTGGMVGTVGGLGGVGLMDPFGGRSAAGREKLVNANGGSAESEACVASGLGWLARHQSGDGRWSLNEFNRHAREQPFPAGKTFPCNCTGTAARRDDMAATAFALLPYLAAGMTHKPSKAPPKVDYSKTVQGGLSFLMSRQGKDGQFPGGMYSHGLVTIVICEAYGLTADPQLKRSAQNALKYIVDAQDPAGGGWRYSPRTAGDTSVTGWQVMALKSGQMAGLSVPYECLKKAERFLESAETPNKGRYAYVPGSGESAPMTAVALLCRMYLGINPRNQGLNAGIEYLKQMPPGRTDNLYYEYYATQVMHHFGGDAWELWNKGPDGKSGIRDTMIKKMDRGLNQKTNHQLGSWAPTSGGHVSEGGRIMATSLSLLCLEVYYRHLPLYRRDMGVMKPDK